MKYFTALPRRLGDKGASPSERCGARRQRVEGPTVWRARHYAVLVLAVATALLAGFGSGVQLNRASGPAAFCPIRVPASQVALPPRPAPHSVAALREPNGY